MTEWQKIIKYLAIAFAFSLIIGIFTGIISLIFGISGIFYSNDEDMKDLDVRTFEYQSEYLEIDIAWTNLNIISGNNFKIETNNKYIRCKESGNKVIISEKRGFIKNKGKYDLTITIPEGFRFNEVDIDAGAGIVDIDTLYTRDLDLDLGAGNVIINYLDVSNEASIDGGAGKIHIKGGTINNLDFDIGAGNAIINSDLTNNSDIDSGVGKLELNLMQSEDNYTFKLEKGIGSISLNNTEIKNGSVIGTGRNRIDIDGGIGSIEITTR